MMADIDLQIGCAHTFFCESLLFYHIFSILRLQLRILDYAISADISLDSTCMSIVISYLLFMNPIVESNVLSKSDLGIEINQSASGNQQIDFLEKKN
jgi:hypothetical protein